MVFCPSARKALSCLLALLVLLPVSGFAYAKDALFSKSDYNRVEDEAEDAVITLEGGHGTLSDPTRGQSGNPVVIERKGVYRITGQSDGVSILISEPKKSGNIYLVLDHVTMTNASGPCIESQAAEKTILQCVGENSLISTAEKGAVISSADDLTVNGSGRLRIEAAKNGINCKETLRITGAELMVQAGNDAIKGKSGLFIDGGSITVLGCYEGLEGESVVIRSGELRVTASDDGINAAGGDGVQGDVVISGGSVTINASGDAIDSNRSILIEGGVILVEGPANGRNSIFDKGDGYDAVLSISGGTVLAIGSAEKTKCFDAGTQYSRLEMLSGHAGDRITTDSGDGVALTASKDFDCVLCSGPNFTAESRILITPASDLPAESEREWDSSVSPEVTDEIRALFDGTGAALAGAYYEPLAVLARQGESYCILCRVTDYSGAQPGHALVYLSGGNGSTTVQAIREIRLDPIFR